MSSRKDLTGQVFGRWTVTRRYGATSSGNILWECTCSCGGTGVVSGTDLRTSNSRSCGCFVTDRNREVHTTHGMKHSITYDSWRCMKGRCLNPKDPSYFRYGERGITMDPSWMQFEAFYKDMGDRPDTFHSIDRIDNNGAYTKENCRWSTVKTQARNRRSNKKVQWRGEELLMCEVIERSNIPKQTVYRRLRDGWTLEQAIDTPLQGTKYD